LFFCLFKVGDLRKEKLESMGIRKIEAFWSYALETVKEKLSKLIKVASVNGTLVPKKAIQKFYQ